MILPNIVIEIASKWLPCHTLHNNAIPDYSIVEYQII